MKKLLLSLAALCMAATMSAQSLLNEGFNAGVPAGWTMYNDNNQVYYSDFQGGAWTACTVTGNPAPCVWTTSFFNPTAVADRWLVTPQLNIPAAGYAVIFDAMNYNASYPDGLTVKISTTDNQKSSFTTVQTYIPGDEWESFMIDLSAYAGQNIYVAFVDQTNDGFVLLLDNVNVCVPPADEIKAVSASMSGYSPMNAVSQVKVTVRNKGAQPLTQFEAYYTVNGGAPTATETVTGINLAFNQTYTYTFNTPFMESVEGTYTVEATVANPNGQADDVADNSATTSTNVYDATNAVERTVLLEHFTTGKCPQCPGGEQRLEEGLAGKTNYIWLKHHAGYYEDEMTCPENTALLAFYNAGGSTYAPGAMFDRSVEFGDGSGTTPVEVPQQASVNAAKLDAALAIPTFSSVAISNVSFDPATRKLSCTVSGTTNGLQNPRISLYLMEDSLLYSQSGAGRIEHMHVMRHAITDVWGEDIQSGSYSKNYEYTVPQSYAVCRCKLIAFVSNYSTDILNRRVANATQTAYINAPYVGIDQVASDVVLNVYPNPATNMVNVNAAEAIREVRIINAIGQEVYVNSNVNAEALQVNTQNYAAGTYMVTVKTDKGLATSRLNVVR